MTNAEKIKRIPHNKLCRFRTLYDGFEKKDMPFADFVCELLNITDQKKMDDDLDEILRDKATFARNKAMIEGTWTS